MIKYSRNQILPSYYHYWYHLDLFILESRSDLTICRMTECSASVTGGKEIMLFCDKVSKDDIQVQFYEETSDGAVTWRALGEFQPTDVHKQYGICFRTPKYKVMEVISFIYLLKLTYLINDNLNELILLRCITNICSLSRYLSQ